MLNTLVFLYWFKPHLGATYTIYLLKDHQISWNYFKVETLRSYWYLTKHISVFDSALHNLWYCCMELCCSNKPGQITNLAKTCSSFTLCSALDLMRSRYLFTIISSRWTFKSDCTIIHDVSNNSLATNINNLFLYPIQGHICYSPAGRSVLGKTVPEVSNTARGRRLRAVLEAEGTVFPNKDRPRPVNNIFIYF